MIDVETSTFKITHQDQTPPPKRSLWARFWDKRSMVVWNPESPGVSIMTTRNRFQRLYRDPYFATFGEMSKHYRRRT